LRCLFTISSAPDAANGMKCSFLLTNAQKVFHVRIARNRQSRLLFPVMVACFVTAMLTSHGLLPQEKSCNRITRNQLRPGRNTIVTSKREISLRQDKKAIIDAVLEKIRVKLTTWLDQKPTGSFTIKLDVNQGGLRGKPKVTTTENL